MTGTGGRVAAVAIALLLVTAGVGPAVGAGDPSSPSDGAADPVAGNDGAVTTVSTTTGSASTTAGNDETTAVTTAPDDSGPSTDAERSEESVFSDDGFRRANASDRDPSMSSRLADAVEAAESGSRESGLATQTREESTVAVVLEAAPGRSDEAAAAARRSGGTVTHRYEDLVEVRLPAGAVGGVADAPSVEFARMPRPVEPSSVTSDGGLRDINVSDLHERGYAGENVTVAVVDLSFDANNPEIADNVVETKSMRGSFTNQSGAHGTAVAELLVDAAPNVSLVLVEATYVTDILAAADYVDDSPSIDAVSMSLGVKSGPWDGSARLDRRLDASVDRGTPWFVSAGNEGDGQHYNATWSDPDGDGYLDFEGTDETLDVTPRCDTCSISVSWNDYPDSDEDYDVWLYDDAGNVLDSSTTVQDGSQPPEESVRVSSPPDRMHLAIAARDANGSARFQIFGSDGARFEYTTSAMTLTRPATAREVVAVGAMNHRTDALEGFSSRGPTVDGRRGVDLVGPDGVTTTARNAFYGTSAAAPYAAGVAALVIGATDRALTPAAVERALADTATDLRGDEPNPATGYGLVDAAAAVGSVVVNAAPSALDFGERRTGDAVTESVTVTNDRSAPLELADVAVSGEDEDAFAVTNGGSRTVLGPGESREVTVEFAPRSHGEKTAELVVSHDDTAVSPTTASLSGTGLAPAASVAPTGHDYGETGVADGTETLAVSVANDGNLPLNVTALDVTGADAAAFRIVSGDGTPVVAPGGTHEVIVAFDPDSLGDATASLSVEHNDSDASPTAVGLTGTGADETAPALDDASATDATDGDGVVADGDAVAVAVNATDALGSVDAVAANASAFGAGTVALSDGDGDGRYSGTFTVNATEAGEDGEYALDVTATDGVGNGNETAAGSLALDATAPELTVTDPTSESATNASAIRVAGTVTDRTSGTEAVEVSVTDAGDADATTTWTDLGVSGDGEWSGSTDAVPDEGTYVVRVRATDAAGNVGPERAATVTVDRTDPTIGDVALDRTGELRPETDLTVGASASDARTGVTAVAADDTPLTATGDGDWSGTVEAAPDLGEHAVTVSARDAAGNAAERTLAYDVGVESTFADRNGTLVATPDRGAVENVTVEATGVSDAETAVVGAAATNPTDVEPPNDTALSFPQVEPSVANADVSDASFAVAVPRSRVEAEFALLDTVRFWVGEDGSWDATNGTLVAENDTHLTYEVAAPHFSTFAVTADADGTKPTVSSLGPADGATVETRNATVTADFGDDHAGVDPSRVALRVDGEDVTDEATVDAGGVTYDATLANGTHDATVAVTDRAGNERVRTWSFDVAPAAAEGDTGGGGAGGGGTGGGGTGGGGADVPPPAVAVELTETTASTVRAKVSSARADAPGRIAPDGGIAAGDATVREVTVTPESRDALPRFSVAVTGADESPTAPPATDALGFVEVDTTNLDPADIDAVTVAFSVPASAAAAPENVALYRHTGTDWAAVETTVVAQRNGRYVLAASAPGTGPLAVGVESPDAPVEDSTTTVADATATEEAATPTGTEAGGPATGAEAGEPVTRTEAGVPMGTETGGPTGTETATPNGGGVPGFGLAVALAALLVGLLAARLRD